MAKVDMAYEKKTFTVSYDPAKAKVEQLLARIKKEGFECKVKQ